MKLKQYTHYGINFYGKWFAASGALMGVSFFLRILYYFFLNEITQVKGSEMILNLVLPCLMCAAYILLLSCIHWNAPGIYGIIGCCFFIFMIGVNIAAGGILQIVLSILWYLIAGVILLGTAGGYLPGKLLAAGCILMALVFRLLIFNCNMTNVSSFVMEVSNLAILGSLACLPMTFIPIEKKQKEQ